MGNRALGADPAGCFAFVGWYAGGAPADKGACGPVGEPEVAAPGGWRQHGRWGCTQCRQVFCGKRELDCHMKFGHGSAEDAECEIATPRTTRPLGGDMPGQQSADATPVAVRRGDRCEKSEGANSGYEGVGTTMSTESRSGDCTGQACPVAESLDEVSSGRACEATWSGVSEDLRTRFEDLAARGNVQVRQFDEICKIDAGQKSASCREQYWRDCLRKYHPDKNPGSETFVTEIFNWVDARRKLGQVDLAQATRSAPPHGQLALGVGALELGL